MKLTAFEANKLSLLYLSTASEDIFAAMNPLYAIFNQIARLSTSGGFGFKTYFPGITFEMVEQLKELGYMVHVIEPKEGEKGIQLIINWGIPENQSTEFFKPTESTT